MDATTVTAGSTTYELVAADDGIGRYIRSTGRPYELRLLSLLLRLAGQGAFIDVGANIGNHSVFFAAHGIPVVAIEPNSEALAMLCENVRRNHLDVHIINAAAGSSPGRGRVVPHLELGMARFEAGDGNVPIITVDDLQVDAAVLKVDVEGAELEVIRGSLELINRCRPILAVETHSLQQRADVASLLRESGYRRHLVNLASTPTYIYLPSMRLWLRAWTTPEVLRRLAFRARALALRTIGRSRRRPSAGD